MKFLLIAAVVFGVNLLPAFGPPTCAVLVFFRLHDHANPVLLVAVDAFAAAGGRMILALASRKLGRHLVRPNERGCETRTVLLSRWEAPSPPWRCSQYLHCPWPRCLWPPEFSM